jgi:hypothetical protein
MLTNASSAMKDWRWFMRKMHSMVMGAKDSSGNSLSWIFEKPVHKYPENTSILKEYYAIITSPMDLGTIRSNLKTYSNPQQFKNDMDLVFDNCLKYNKVGQDSYEMGFELKKFFEEKCWKRFVLFQ